MEIRVDVQGRSCHGSAPERGDNAIFKMAPILIELQGLAKNLGDDEFLGKGTLTVSEIFFTSPTRCAVADSCAVSIDRRLTWGETWERALDEIRALPAVKAAQRRGLDVPLRAAVLHRPGLPHRVLLPDLEDARRPRHRAHAGACLRRPVQEQAGDRQVDLLHQRRVHHGPPRHPVVGFGPGKEPEAHAPNEKTWKEHLVKCAAMYAAVPVTYLQELAQPA